MAGRGRSTRQVIIRDFETAPASRNIIVFPFSGYTEDIRYVYDTAASIATTAKIRKITDNSAPGAAPSATVIELTGPTGSGTENMQAAANTPRTVPLIANAAARRFKAGDKLAINFSSAATGLAGLVVTVMFRVDQFGGK